MIEQDLAEPSLPPPAFTPAPAYGDGPAAGLGDLADAAITRVASAALDASQFEAAYNAQRYDGDQFGRMNALSASADRRNVEVQRRTGVTLENPFEGGYDAEARARLAPDERLWGDAVVNVTTQARRPFLDDRLALHQQRLGELAAQYPDHADAIGASRPLIEDAKQLADFWTRRAATGPSGLNAVTGAAASFLGSAAAFMRNPVNLGLTLATGGGEPAAATLAGKMAQMFFREGAVNAGLQLFAEPAVQSFRAERGQEAGALEGAKDVGAAFLFGGAFGAAIPAAKAAFLRFMGSPKAAEAAARGAAQAHEADMAVLADAPPSKGLSTALNQALDRGEGVRDALPEMPASISSASNEVEKIDVPLERGPFEAAAALRADPEQVKAALASDAPDIQSLGRLASLGDAAFEEARAGRVSTDIALATAARVTDDAEQLATMRGAQLLDPKTPDEAAAAVSREMEARTTPAALRDLHAIDEPAAAVPAPKFRRETEGARDKQIEALKGEIERSIEQVIPPKKKRAVAREFPTLFETLASEGGLAPHPELKAIFDGNPFVPGFGRLMRKGGKTLDQALQSAKDLGYMFDAADQGAGELKLAVNDLLDLLRREAHGDKVYSFEDQARMVERDAARAGKEFERQRAKAEKTLRADKAVDFDETWPPDRDVMAKATLILAEDDALAPAQAWKQAMEEYRREAQARYERFDELHQGRYDETGPIPGFDEPAAAADGETTSRPGGAGARAGEEKAGAGGGAGADRPGAGTDRPASGPGESLTPQMRRMLTLASGELGASTNIYGKEIFEASRNGWLTERSNGRTGQSRVFITDEGRAALNEAPAFEPGAEGKPQALIPGVAPVTDRQRAELAASKPMRGGDAAPPAGGLFDEGARAQMDILDLTPTEDGRALPVAEAVAGKTREQLIAEIVSRCPF